MRNQGPQGELAYPEGDHPQGVVFYYIDSKHLPWRECQRILHDIAVDFARNGPFVVRYGVRWESSTHYWVGLNAAECGVAFGRAVDLSRLRIKTANRLPGANPNQLKPVLEPDDYQSYQGGALQPGEDDDEWGAPAAQSTPPAVEYEDRHTGTVFYRLVNTEIDPVIVVETIMDIAGIMLQSLGQTKPFALRYGIRTGDEPGTYWVGLNSTTAGALLERTLESSQVRVSRRSKMPDGSQPVLRLALSLPGVPVFPRSQVPVAAPAPRPRVEERAPIDPPESLPIEHGPAGRQLRSEVGRLAERLRARVQRQRRGQPPPQPDDS